MPPKVFFSQRKAAAAAAALCIVLLLLAQQVCAGPLGPRGQSSPEQKADSSGVQTLRRIARMTPLWRIISSKPNGAYCQNNYECSTGLCRAGHCSTNRGPSETVTY